MTREIPRSDWPTFFDAFSRTHDRWMVALEVMDTEVGDQVEGRDLCFRGIVAETRPPQDALAIMLETPGGNYLSHSVKEPMHVWLETDGDDTDAALQIEAADRGRTLMQFRAVPRPDTDESTTS